MNIMLYILLFILNVVYNLDIKACEIIDGVYESSSCGRENYIESIKQAKTPIIIGTYKFAPELIPPQDLIDAIDGLKYKNIICNIIIEDRLTNEERRISDNNLIIDRIKSFENTNCKILLDPVHYLNVHFKIFLTDSLAIISTTNYGDINYKNKRDFSLFTKDRNIIEELTSAIKNLLEGKEIIPKAEYNITDFKKNETKLSWGPRQHKNHILEMIKSASNEILIYQQSLEDIDIVRALIERLQNQIKIRIVMSRYPFGKNKPNKNLKNLKILADNGAEIILTDNDELEIHAKILIKDQEMMYLGSANFYPSVLNSNSRNLNLGVITTNDKYIKTVIDYFIDDFNKYKKL